MRQFLGCWLASACAAVAFGSDIVVGSKQFTESYVLGEIGKSALIKAGFKAEHKQGMGKTIILWQALTSGSISAYPEYTGTISKEILKSDAPLTDDDMRAKLKSMGIGMSSELGFNNTYALVMLASAAKRISVSKISDLKDHENLRCGLTLEFIGRNDGWKPLLARYGLQMANVKGIDHNLGYEALERGDIEIKDAYSTDAAIAEKGLTLLDDDIQFFPKYNAVFLYRLNLPAKAIAALNTLGGKIDGNEMRKLNASAEKSKDFVAAANEFWTDRGQTAMKDDRSSVAAELLTQAGQHLTMVGISLLIAVLVGLPLGIWASRPSFGGAAILSVCGLIQTVPSLALLAVLVPWLGTEPRTAIVALFLYSLLPIVRNTATGIQTIPPSLRESAVALGFEPLARLRKIELPMASPTILAGIKTSAIINVGTATIAAFIGAGGLGQPIQTGLALSDTNLILRGAVAAAVLALLVQFAFDLLERAIVPRGLRLGSGR